MVKGTPSPKASQKTECDLEQPWKEGRAVGTLPGEGHRGYTQAEQGAQA